MAYLKTTAIVLKKFNVREHDQYVTFFSPEMGKIQALAKGARKVSSGFTGHMEILNICDVELYSKGEHLTMVQCHNKKVFKNLRDDLSVIVVASIVLEIFENSSKGTEQSRQLFDLIVSIFEKLDDNPDKKRHDLLIEYFKIQILLKNGTLPELTSCQNCQKRWTSNVKIFIAPDGEINCVQCCQRKKTYEELPFNILKLLVFLAKKNIDELPTIHFSGSEKENIKKITSYFLEQYLERSLYSEKFAAHLIKA